MESAETARRILGCLPEPDAEALGRVRARAEARRLLLPDERCLAGVDESWLGTAGRGVVLTDKRILRFRGDRATDVAAFPELERARVRRMWYPPPPLLGRGEDATGPVVILRFRFDLRDGRHARLRLQDHAGALRPFVEALVERFP
jgi:hypothetical protein